MKPDRSKTLDDLAIEVGTDKSSQHHGYTSTYEEIFGKKRHESVNLLELGWGQPFLPGGSGASARLWARYFTQPSSIVFVDIELTGEPVEGTSRYEGDQADAELLSRISRLHAPGGWDFVIDDASHLSSLTVRSFEALWPHMAPGGIYVVEDTHSSYHEHYYGAEEASADPTKPTKSGRPTAMQWFKRLADEVNADLLDPRYRLHIPVRSVEFRKDLVIVRFY